MRSKKYMIYGILLIVLTSIGVSYAYFRSDVEGNSKNISLSSKNIRILLTDNMEITNTEITPGWSTSKTFSVKNESKEVFNYNIVIKDLVNTFVTTGFLQYKITSSNGYNTEGYIDIPKSSEAKDTPIVFDIDIEPNVTQEYTIEFIYHNSEEVDQSEDMGKVFSGMLAIVEGTIDPNKFYSVEVELSNGRITSENPGKSLKNGSLTYTYEMNEGYSIGNVVTCDNGATGAIENNEIVIRNITSNNVCIVESKIKTYIVELEVINGRSDALNHIVNHGSNAEFTITPNTGYTTSGATLTGEGCTLEGNKVKVNNVTNDKSCTLTLVKEKYQVILTGSNVTVSDSSKSVEYEGNTTFTVTPGVGFTMSNASVNCDNGATASINGNEVTISNVKGANTCTITAKQLTYELTLAVTGGSGGSTKTVSHGGSTTYTISANTGYVLTSPTITCTGSATGSISGSTVTISNVTATQTCTVALKKQTYIVSASVSGGVASPTSQVIEHGSSKTFTISANTGYNLSGTIVSGEGCSLSSDKKTLTASNVISARTCTVTIPKNTYAVTVTSTNTSYGTIGTISPNPVEHGGSVTVTLSPKSGYKYSSNTCGGSVSGNTMTISNITGAKTCQVTFVDAVIGKTLFAVLTDGVKYSNVLTRTDFSVTVGTSTATTGTIYKTTNPNETETGTSTPTYYFAGNVGDNWVKFAGYYWRIIRTNSDNSVRLLYAGTTPDTTEGYISTTAYINNSPVGSPYVGYMYGTVSKLRENTTNSTIKTSVDNWYKDNIHISYGKYVSETAIYCNDRSSGRYSVYDKTYFAAWNRLSNRVGEKPTYRCGFNSAGGFFTGMGSEANPLYWIVSDVGMYSDADPGDNFTKSASTGNGKLIYPVALMTIDELIMAGGKLNTANPYVYYYLNSANGSVTGTQIWWTMSPAYNHPGYAPSVFRVYGSHATSVRGYLDAGLVTYVQAVRPVVSLKSIVLVSGGNGTASSPYTIE